MIITDTVRVEPLMDRDLIPNCASIKEFIVGHSEINDPDEEAFLVDQVKKELDSDSGELSLESLKFMNKMCSESYDKLIDMFKERQKAKCERYRFVVLSDQLAKICRTNVEVTRLLECVCFEIIFLLNHIISECKQPYERIKIQYEFMGLNVSEQLRICKNKFNLNSQIEEQIMLLNTAIGKEDLVSNDTIDLNSHVDIFHAIYSQVKSTPHEYTFLCILRHLLRLDPANRTKQNATVWELVEKLVCRASVFNEEDNSVASLERYANEKFHSFLSSSTTDLSSESSSSRTCAPVPSIPPPPPPLPPSFLPLNNIKLSTTTTDKISSSDETKLAENSNSSKNGESVQVSEIDKLPQQCVPKPHCKMKPLVWSKIHPNRIVGKENLWTKVNRISDTDKSVLLDGESQFFQEVEEFFKVNENSRPDFHLRDSNLKEHKNSSANEKINLLDSKRSLNINIYLKQFRCSPSEIVRQLSNNENLGLENLEGMLKILPDANEIELLRGYQGEIEKLGEAENFLFKLIQVPNYKLRIESLLLKEEFNNQMFYFRKSFENIFKATETIQNSVNLATMMLYICKTGNFINEGSYSGNAAGFKLSSLIKLCELKSNKSNITLFHLIIQQLEDLNSKVIELPQEFAVLKSVTSIQLESLKSEISTFCNRIKKLTQQLSDTNDPQLYNLKDFIDGAFMSIKALEEHENSLESWRIKLADHFCEDPNTFKLEECFNVLDQFLEKMRAILNENKEKRSNEQRRNSKLASHSEEPHLDGVFRRNGSINNRFKTNSDHSSNELAFSKTDSYPYRFNTIRPSHHRRSLMINRHQVSPISLVGSSSTSNLLMLSGNDNKLQLAPSDEKTSPDTSQLISFLNDGLVEAAKEEKNSDVGMVKLRRSSSTTDVDWASRVNFRRCGITSAILKEEDLIQSTADHENSQDASNTGKARLTSLKKLGSLYREFDQLDDEYFEKARSSRRHPIKYIDEDETDKANGSQQSSTMPTSKSVTLDEKYINSKFKYATELRQSTQSKMENGSNIVLERIMKFEGNTGANNMLNGKTSENESSSSITSVTSLTNETQSTEAVSKVKSISKNWEMMVAANSSRNGSTSSGNSSVCNTPRSTPLNIVTSIKPNRFTDSNFDSTISSSSNSNLVSPNIINMMNKDLDDAHFDRSASTSDNEHSSKDDGFETQSNASLSQKSDSVTIKIKNTEESNTSKNELLININTEEKNGQASVKSDDSIADSNAVVLSPDGKPGNKSKDIPKPKQAQQQTIVTITTRSRKKSTGPNGTTVVRPLSTSISTLITSKKLPKSSQINLSISATKSGMSVADRGSKKKAGSTLALHLVETASTKAKRANAGTTQPASVIAQNVQSSQVNPSHYVSSSNLSMVQQQQTTTTTTQQNQKYSKIWTKKSNSSMMSASLLATSTSSISTSTTTISNPHNHQHTHYPPNMTQSVFERLSKTTKK